MHVRYSGKRGLQMEANKCQESFCVARPRVAVADIRQACLCSGS